MGLRFNPPPGWPPVPEGFTPEPGWQPDPSWPPAPPGWQLWVNDDQLSAGTVPSQAMKTGPSDAPPPPAYGAGGQHIGAGDQHIGAGDLYVGAGGEHIGAGDQHIGGGDQHIGAGDQHIGAGDLHVGAGTQHGGAGAPDGNTGSAHSGTGGQYGGAAPYGPAGTPPGTGPTSGWAIASFVLGLLSVVLLSVIFAFIALRRIKRLGQRGRGFAIAGLVLSGVWVVIIVIAVVAANAGKATRSAATGVITHRGRINAFSLRVGDCFDNPPGAQTVNIVTAIPCDQPHNAQIYARFKLTGSDASYPGAAVVAQTARDGCNARVGSVNKSMTTSAMSVRILLPEKIAWMAGQRAVSCMIVNPKATLTASLLNSAPGAG